MAKPRPARNDMPTWKDVNFLTHKITIHDHDKQQESHWSANNKWLMKSFSLGVVCLWKCSGLTVCVVPSSSSGLSSSPSQGHCVECVLGRDA